jgi:nucleotide-binding universal stress UspA family protein
MRKRMLVAVDGSRTSEAGLGDALDLAGRGAQLRAVSVEDSPYNSPDALYGQVTGDLEPVRREWRETGEKILARAAASVRARRVAADSTLLESDGRRVGAAVVEAAQRWGADLIVVGTHGQRGLDWLLLGSVAKRVARTAPVSVPLVRGGTR